MLLLGAAGGSQAQPCSPETIAIDRGETRRVVLCAAGLPETYVLAAPPGLTVTYEKRLRHCAIGDSRPGLHLVLSAAADARSGALSFGSDVRSESACTAIQIDVPERVRLPDATLTSSRRAPGALELRVRAPTGADLTPACESGPGFALSDGMTLGASGRIDCDRSALRWLVTPLDSRRLPAKIVLPARGTDGALIEAITYAEPPEPRWLAAMAESEARFVDVAGVRTRYFEKGRGDALVLVHGGQPSSMDGTAWDWQQNFDGLAEHFHVYALDRLGQGYTANPANLDDYANYYVRVVEHLRGFIRAMGLRRVHLVGHSQGSWPVTRIALDEPGLVASLTLVDGTMVAPARDAGSAVRFYLYLTQDLHPPDGETPESARRGMELFSHTRNNITAQRVGRLVTMTTQDKYARAQAWFAKSGMSPAHPAFRALKQQILDELGSGRLRVPVLVVWGANDPEGSLASGLELFRMVSASSPRARLHVFGRSGHLSFVEYPEEFNRVLTGFALDASGPLASGASSPAQ